MPFKAALVSAALKVWSFVPSGGSLPEAVWCSRRRFTDRAMPEMSGDQFTAAVKRMLPGKPIVMLTGFGELMAARGERPSGVDVVVSKPVTRSDLQRAVAQATAR